MRTLYLDCQMGAAGDMLTAALLELLPDPDGFIEELNSLGIPGVTYKKQTAEKCGITGTQVSVLINGTEETSCGAHHHSHDAGHGHDSEHRHAHSSLHDIEHIVRSCPTFPADVISDILSVYRLIAEAESHVHGVPVTDIHFHEVGTMDAVADVTAVCLLIRRLKPEQIIASPVHTGSGQVHCAHGILPVPAPATAYILQGIPICSGSIRSELCTPTGAALLKHFVSSFGEMPVMTPSALGYGMGKKDFPAANCIRAVLGDTCASSDDVFELQCNVDDMTGEAAGHAMDRLFDAGALEVFTSSVGMKKNRPGILIHVLCRAAEKEAVIQALFRHTTTIGIREVRVSRRVLDRRIETVSTPYGSVRRKISSGYGIQRCKYEYDDIARIARERNISYEEALLSILTPEKNND